MNTAGKLTLRSAWLMTMIALAGCTGDQPEEKILRPVRYEQVFSTGGSRVRSFSGIARAGQESRLSFKVPGTVSSIPIKIGDTVTDGQILALLAPEDYRLQVEDAEASYAQAVARARNARANLERVRGLYENDNASRNDYDAARTEYESANAQVESVRKKTELAGLQLSYTKLTSPVDGAISAVNVEINENVQAGQTVAVITSGNRLEVQVAIPEMFITRINEGDRVSVTFDTLPGKSFGAVITEVGVSASGAAMTFPVIARLSERSENIRPGMAAEVSFRFEDTGHSERMLLPAGVVSEDQNGRFVFVVEPTGDGLGVVHRRDVRVGDLTGDGLEIFDGLQDGEYVITAGVSKIEDGMEVRVPELSAVTEMER